MSKLRKKVEFLKLIEKFKTIERFNKTSDQSRAESDAEHTWHLVMMIYLLAEDFPGINQNHAIEIALVHDLPEIITGDTSYWDSKTVRCKAKEESVAAKRLFKGLPREWSERLILLWYEYENKKTLEAKFVYALDKLQPVLQRLVSEDNGLIERRVGLNRVMKAKPSEITDDTDLSEIWDLLVAESIKKGLIWGSSSKDVTKHVG